MPESVAAMDCPAVPPRGNGTAGQINPAPKPTGTPCGTSAGTARLQALEKLALLRDRQRDRGRDNAPNGSAALSRRPVSQQARGGTVSATVPNPVPPCKSAACLSPLDLGELPANPCPACGAGLWWRVSMLAGGPGPWHCERCIPPDPADWIDGCAVPLGTFPACAAALPGAVRSPPQ